MSKKTFKLFNLIAPLYAQFYNFQVRYYIKTLIKMKKDIDFREYNTILDIGCGTGALCYVLNKTGLQVTGVVTAINMVEKSKEKLKETNVQIEKVNPNEKFPFKDKSFDIVISFYVIHGLKPKERAFVYKEASRLAKEKVIFHDYNQNRALLTTIVEWFERGDYFNFIKNAKNEMDKYFGDIKIIDVYERAAWYILTPFKE